MGTYERDRPPIFSIVARQSGLLRYFVRHRADSATCLEVVRSTIPAWEAMLFTDGWKGYSPVEDEVHIWHGTVEHGREGGKPREWVRDDDGDGIREVHCNSCEGAGTGLRTYLRMFRGVHKKYLEFYVALYETMANAKCISATVIRRMCFGNRVSHADCT